MLNLAKGGTVAALSLALSACSGDSNHAGSAGSGGSSANAGGGGNPGSAAGRGAQGGSTDGGATQSAGGTATSAGMGGAPASGGGAGAGQAGAAVGGGGNGGSAGGAGASVGGTSGGPGCSGGPVTPNATMPTRKVLCYLYSIVGKNILSAQEEDNSDEAMNFVFRVSQKYPAIRAFDLNNSRAPTQCVEHSRKGGLCMFGYHMGINGDYRAAVDLDRVIQPGTNENTTLNARLDVLANAFQMLQTVNGVGFVRLFHEVGNGCRWFWWTATGNANQYNALWRYAFRYLTQTKGLKNTLWLLPLCGNANSGAWNPGKEFVDLGGSDTYKNPGDYQPITAQYNETQRVFPGLPIALHENGPIPDPDLLQSTGTKWVMFNTWSDHFNPPNNSEQHTNQAYNHSYVITLDELPSFQ